MTTLGSEAAAEAHACTTAVGAATPPEAPKKGSDEDDGEILDFWASMSKKRKVAKLHRTGSCHFFPMINVQDFTFGNSPDDLQWTSLCKTCWKGIPGPEFLAPSVAAAEVSPADSSSSGSSSSSSDSQDAGV